MRVKGVLGQWLSLCDNIIDEMGKCIECNDRTRYFLLVKMLDQIGFNAEIDKYKIDKKLP